jgi:hypothetical protein
MTKKAISIKKPATGRSIVQNLAITRAIVKKATKNDHVVSGVAK